MTRGWHGQSYRHYLAANGMKTRYDAEKIFLAVPELPSNFNKMSVDKREKVIAEFEKKLDTQEQLLRDFEELEQLQPGIVKRDYEFMASKIPPKSVYEEKWMDKLGTNQRTDRVRWLAAQDRLKDLAESER